MQATGERQICTSLHSQDNCSQGSQRAHATLLHISGVKAGCRGAQLCQAVLQTCCRQEDMSILGDPVELAFTQMIQQEFGWRPRSELPMCTACMTDFTSRARGLDSYAVRVTAAGAAEPACKTWSCSYSNCFAAVQLTRQVLSCRKRLHKSM